MSTTRTALVLDAVSKRYGGPAGEVHALADVNLDVAAGELVAVVGRSGSGKSTLLHLAAGLDKPSAGGVSVAGARMDSLDEDAAAAFRGANIGVLFQFFQLLPTLTIAENVVLAMDFVGAVPAAQRHARARELLGRVGVADQADKLPATLSGGQQQRAALARALANDPALLLADEPTGNLDSDTAAGVLRLFEDLAGDGKTVIIVTHDAAIAARTGRVVELADGRVVRDERRLVAR